MKDQEIIINRDPGDEADAFRVRWVARAEEEWQADSAHRESVSRAFDQIEAAIAAGVAAVMAGGPR